MEYSDRDEYEIKNMYCTTDQIDERQAIELALLLDRWEKNELDPEAVIKEAASIVGTFFDRNNCKFRPEVLDRSTHNDTVVSNIADIKTRLENSEFSSWDAAIAIAEVIIIPPVEGEKYSKRHTLNRFKERVKEQKEWCEKEKKDPAQTLSFFKPETEEEIKWELAKFFAKRKAWLEWQPKNYGKNTSLEYFTEHVWPYSERKEETPEFISPVNLPDRKICGKMRIVPSGTGLIEVYERSEYDTYVSLTVYGKPVANITTYSVSFVPDNPEDLEELKGVVSEAVEILGDVPYKYELPGSTETGESYRRPPRTDDGYGDYETTASTYIDTTGGKVMPSMRFDLDDLWTLYYMLEPIIKPNIQVAVAMNSARHAEERGAILEPNGYDYVYSGHSVENKRGYIDKNRPDEALPKIMQDTLEQWSIGEIDEGEVYIRMRLIAQKLADAQAKKGDLVDYEKVVNNKTRDLICAVAGENNTREPVKLVLARARQKLEGPLKEHFRDEARKKQMAFYEEANARRLNRTTDIFLGFNDYMERQARDIEESDAVSGYDPEKEISSDAMAEFANIVLAASKVEPCVDGIHANGRYRSRLKGSPYPRKELPKALQPFAPNNDRTIAAQKFLDAPETTLE